MRIAIIGSGIAGLGAAYLLHPHHEIMVFEKNLSLGGHARTVDVVVDQTDVAVDTGFIVFNKRNYPHLTGLFDHLKVPYAKSDMSFGASIDNGWLEYGSVGIRSLFAQKRNMFRPAYWRMLKDIVRFNKQAHHHMASTKPLGEVLNEMGMGDWFRRYYLLAMGAAIWSMPLESMLKFPARTFLRFFENHGLLTVSDHPQWYTVHGGSRNYVNLVSASFIEKVRLGAHILTVERDAGGVTITLKDSSQERFDKVIFACHPDQAMALLKKPTDKEKAIIGAFRYQPNRAVLHTDASLMPRRRRAWTSWVYRSEQRSDNKPAVSLSYWMNNLQPLPVKTPLLVTLNPGHEPHPDHRLDEHMFDHPVFDEAAIHAQEQLPTLQGEHHTYYAGAWTRYGFHEDGLLSAVNVAAAFGIVPPWQSEEGLVT